MQALAWVDWDWNVAQGVLTTVTAVAAVVAVVQARQTVRETQAMRREERLADILELVAEAGRHLVDIARNVQFSDTRLGITRLRLEAALDATGEELPECRKLLTVHVTANDDVQEVLGHVEPAFTELRALLVEAATK